MLHHYNYSTSLSHFFNYNNQQLEDSHNFSNDHDQSITPIPNTICEEFTQQEIDRSNNTNNPKSFTIAAILGLKNEEDTSSNIVNLSVHQVEHERTMLSGCSRLQLPAASHSFEHGRQARK